MKKKLLILPIFFLVVLMLSSPTYSVTTRWGIVWENDTGGWVSDLQFNSDSSLLLNSDSFYYTANWSSYPGEGCGGIAQDWHPDKKYVCFSASGNGNLTVWNVTDGSILTTTKVGDYFVDGQGEYSYHYDVEYSRDGSLIAVPNSTSIDNGGTDDIVLFNSDDLTINKTLDIDISGYADADDVDWNKDDTLVGYVSVGGTNVVNISSNSVVFSSYDNPSLGGIGFSPFDHLMGYPPNSSNATLINTTDWSVVKSWSVGSVPTDFEWAVDNDYFGYSTNEGLYIYRFPSLSPEFNKSGLYRNWELDFSSNDKWMAHSDYFDIIVRGVAEYPPEVKEIHTYNSSYINPGVFSNEKLVVDFNVTDYNGRGDIESVLINITDPTGDLRVENAPVQNISTVPYGYTYEYNYSNLNEQGDNWTIDVFANETKGFTDTNSKTFSVDLTNPFYYNVSDNSTGTYPNPNTVVKHSAYWEEDIQNLSYAKFAWNDSGTWQNVSTHNFNLSKSGWSNFSEQVTADLNQKVCWRIWTNSSPLNWWNVTPIKCYKIIGVTIEGKAPKNHTTKAPPVDFVYNITCPNTCNSYLYYNKTENTTRFWMVNTTSEWNQGIFINTTNKSGNLVLSKKIIITGTYWYDFEDPNSTSILDEWNNISADIYGASYISSLGKNGTGSYALSFDGTDDYIAIDHSMSTSSLSQFTSCAWVNVPTDGGDWSILDYDRSEYFTFAAGVPDAASSPNGEGDYIGFHTTSSGGTTDDFSGNFVIRDGKWHHVCVVYNSSAINDKKIYVDGDLDASKDAYSTGTDIGTGTTRYAFIGDGSEASSYDGSRNDLYYQGDVDEVSFFKGKALNQSTIQDIYASGYRGYKSSGIYSSRAFDAGKPVWWKNSSFNKSIPSGTNYSTDWAEKIGGEWTWYDNFSDVPKSRFLRFNITMKSNGTDTPRIDWSNISYTIYTETYKRRKSNQTPIIEGENNTITVDFNESGVKKWQIEGVDSSGLNKFTKVRILNVNVTVPPKIGKAIMLSSNLVMELENNTKYILLNPPKGGRSGGFLLWSIPIFLLILIGVFLYGRKG